MNYVGHGARLRKQVESCSARETRGAVKLRRPTPMKNNNPPTKSDAELLKEELEQAVLNFANQPAFRPSIQMSYGKFLKTKQLFRQELNADEKHYLFLYEKATKMLANFHTNLPIHIVIDQAKNNILFELDGNVYSEDEIECLMKQKAFL